MKYTVETIRKIYSYFVNQQGMWSDYVDKALVNSYTNTVCAHECLFSCGKILNYRKEKVKRNANIQPVSKKGP